MIKIGLAQINPWVGDLENNFKKIIDYLNTAKKKKVDILVFPELALCGYPPEDLLLNPHFVEENIKFLHKLTPFTKGITAVIGFVNRDKDKIYNAAALLGDGKIKDIYHKVNLPNYGVFDEKRYFTPGDSLSFYEFGDYRFSVNICEDIWKEAYTNQLRDKDLDFVINISASPFHLGKFLERENILSRTALRAQAYVFYCNLVGGQDELVFDGASMVISPQGKLISYAKRFYQDLLTFTVGKKSHPTKHIHPNEAEEAFGALRLGLFDYVTKNGFKKVIVGVSGGIDSAVVVSLATLTLGRKNVGVLIMPSRYTSPQTFRDAKKICQNLGVKYYIVNIEEIFRSYLNTLGPFFKGTKLDKTEENIQARIRGNILMAFSNKFGYLVLNTGNKSELSCGYCTLYGDMVGGFGVLKDVPKSLVYKLAHYINKISNKKVIPSSVIRRAPSAELKPNQKDSDALPPYSSLDPILKLYVEENYPLEGIVRKGFEEELVREVMRMVDSNEYKRRQAPIGIKITPRAFGKDRRMPITNKFNSR
jgi:NAD+ synthase (glutamine-hydrolysing)